jgi:transcriptional regulator of arginine metabolism
MNIDQAILRLLKQHRITEQAELLLHLEQEGLNLTQSTLSRHFRRLAVVKLDGRYQHVEAPRPPTPAFSVDTAPPNILVVRVGPGLASSLALKLDQSDLEGVVGTVAGDDTLIVVVKPPERLHELRREVEAFLTRNA